MIVYFRRFFPVVLAVIIVLAALSGCSSDFYQGENDYVERDDSGYFDDSPDNDADNNRNYAGDRKIIYTSSLKIETTEYDNSISSLERLVDEYEGFIQSSKVETRVQTGRSSSLRRATYTIRIPAERRLSFISSSGNVGKIVLNETRGDDVTDQFFDTQARLDSLEVQETRLIQLMEEASNLSDILDIEDRLSQVRYEIEYLTGTLSKLSALVSLSTVNVEITEVREITEPSPDTFWGEIQDTFRSSVFALVRTLRVIALGVVAIFPFIALIFVLVFILVLIIKKTRKSKIKKDNH